MPFSPRSGFDITIASMFGDLEEGSELLDLWVVKKGDLGDCRFAGKLIDASLSDWGI